MSTKIFNGYCLPKMTFEELHNFCLKIRPIFEKRKTELLVNLYSNNIIHNLDLFYAGLSVEKPNLHKTWEEIYSRVVRIERTKERDPLVDFEVNAVFFPIADKILALFYAERKEMQELWQNFTEVKDYSYWDNVDPDEDVSDKEWINRKNDWEKALPDFNPPSRSGFTFIFTDNSILLTNAGSTIEKVQAAKDERVLNLARGILTSQYYKLRENRANSKEDLPCPHLESYEKFEASEEGKKELSKIREEIYPKLKEKYVLHDFYSE